MALVGAVIVQGKTVCVSSLSVRRPDRVQGVRTGQRGFHHDGCRHADLHSVPLLRDKWQSEKSVFVFILPMCTRVCVYVCMCERKKE